MGRFQIHLLAWLPAAFLAWLAAPFGIPEALRASSRGPFLQDALHAAIVVATLGLAYWTYRRAPPARVEWSKLLGRIALFLIGLGASFLWGLLGPTRNVDRVCQAGRLQPQVCERYSLGSDRPIPYFRLQKGPLDPGPCPAATSTVTAWTWGEVQRPLSATPCPAGLAPARCFSAAWADPAGDPVLGFLALAPDCAQAVELEGRGAVAEARIRTIRGF